VFYYKADRKDIFRNLHNFLNVSTAKIIFGFASSRQVTNCRSWAWTTHSSTLAKTPIQVQHNFIAQVHRNWIEVRNRYLFFFTSFKKFFGSLDITDEAFGASDVTSHLRLQKLILL